MRVAWQRRRDWAISCGRVTSMLAVGVSSATRESSKIQNPAEATAVLSVIIGMTQSETAGIDITSSRRAALWVTAALPDLKRPL